jgi:hypothetical protein
VSPPCHQEIQDEIRRRPYARVIDLERARLERVAREIANQLQTGGGSVCRLTVDIDDIDRWRRGARRAGRILGMSVRTGVSCDGQKVWAAEGP